MEIKMTFKTGDRVKFLNDVGGGIITRIKNQIAYVETSDGFEIPSSFSELLPDGDMGIKKEDEVIKYRKETKKIQKPEPEPELETVWEPESDSDEILPEDEIITSENSTLNILLGFVPEKIKNSSDLEFNIFLISDCSYRMMYSLSIVKENFCYGHKAGFVEEDTKVLVTRLTSKEIRELQSFKINCIFFKKGIYLPHEPLIYEHKIDLFQLSDPQNWVENDYFDPKAIIINLTEESLIYEIERQVTENEEKFIIQKKRRDIKRSLPKSQDNSDVEEVDLHIEHLVDDFAQLEASEILDIQMGRFTITLEGAVKSNTKKIIFIHGVGNGKLKFEIRKTLDTKYPHLKYQDASFKEYGYGATMVLLKK
jgi:hypothetical protein